MWFCCPASADEEPLEGDAPVFRQVRFGESEGGGPGEALSDTFLDVPPDVRTWEQLEEHLCTRIAAIEDVLYRDMILEMSDGEGDSDAETSPEASEAEVAMRPNETSRSASSLPWRLVRLHRVLRRRGVSQERFRMVRGREVIEAWLVARDARDDR